MRYCCLHDRSAAACSWVVNQRGWDGIFQLNIETGALQAAPSNEYDGNIGIVSHIIKINNFFYTHCTFSIKGHTQLIFKYSLVIVAYLIF